MDETREMPAVECWRGDRRFHVRLPGDAAASGPMAPFAWLFRDPREVAAETAPPGRIAA